MRSRSGQLKRALPGSALIAARSGAPILPVGITGTEKIRGISWLRRPKILVNIGNPFYLTPVDCKLTIACNQCVKRSCAAERFLKETEFFIEELLDNFISG